MILLPREQGVCEASEQRGRSGIYRDASGLSQRALRESAAEHANSRDLRLPRCGGIVWRVADRDGIAAFDLKLLENDLEDVRRRFRFFYVVGRSFQVYQVGDASDVEVLVDFILLGRGSNSDPKSSVAHASQQVRNRREGTHPGEGVSAWAAWGAA
jgi:hypothetical protein